MPALKLSNIIEYMLTSIEDMVMHSLCGDEILKLTNSSPYRNNYLGLLVRLSPSKGAYS